MLKSSEATKKWWSTKTPEFRKDYHRRNKLKSLYGITEEEFLKRAEAQGWKCGLCKKYSAKGTPGNWKYGLVVDHCHVSNKIRGLLCNKCNQGLGYFNDSVELLTSAIEWISKGESF